MNVLLIMADQHLATCLGHEGHLQALTPHLDRLAAGATRFRHAYTQNPICTPSRTSIFSGQYCHNHGYFGLSGPAPEHLPSFLSHFKQHGYRTAGIGNLHTPNNPRDWLEHHVDFYGECFEGVDGQRFQTPFYEYIRKLGLLEWEDHYRVDVPEPHLAMEGMPSQLPFEHSQEGWCVQEAIKFMDSCRGQPFCMEVSLERPHSPWFPARQFWDMYPDDLALPPTIDQDPSGRPPHFRAAYEAFHNHPWVLEPKDFETGARRAWRGYLACITHVDHAVGLLLDHLDRAGLAKDTLVIYTADHGAYSGTYGIQEKAPGICSEAVCRVPSLWRGPGVTAAGAVNRQLVEQVDIAPTLASLCGLPAMETVDGRDLSPLLRGGAEAVREVAVTEHPWSKALRWKQWRFVHYQREMFNGQDIGELYDIDGDPNETRNLYHDPAHQAVVLECRRLLLEWLIRTTRVKTVWPPVTVVDFGRAATSHWDYAPAGDGKEANTAGPALRFKRGQPYYL
jgi:arylsulfatase A-like enzyme